MATHFDILAWKIPRTEEPESLWNMGSPRVRHDWALSTHTHTHTHAHRISTVTCRLLSSPTLYPNDHCASCSRDAGFFLPHKQDWIIWDICLEMFYKCLPRKLPPQIVTWEIPPYPLKERQLKCLSHREVFHVHAKESNLSSPGLYLILLSSVSLPDLYCLFTWLLLVSLQIEFKVHDVTCSLV